MPKSHSSMLAAPVRLEQGAVSWMSSEQAIVEVTGRQGSRRMREVEVVILWGGRSGMRLLGGLSLLEVPVQGCLCGSPVNGIVYSSIRVFLPFVIG